MNSHFDVIVVGGGGSGLAAAVSAAEHGLSVLVLEKRSTSGGTTGMAVGSFTACNTSFQNAKGIADELQAHVEDAGKFAPSEIEQHNNATLRRFFLSESAKTLDWLTDMGVYFQGPFPEPPNRVPRMHNVVPRAMVYISTLRQHLLDHGGQIVCGARVESLIRKAGRVTGVRAELSAEQRDFFAKRGVVLAAGDYSNSPQLLAEHKGSDFASIEGINRDATGDGHRLLCDAGAKLINMEVTYGPEIRFIPPTSPGWLQRLPTQGLGARLLGHLARWLPRRLEARIAKHLLVTWQHPEDSLLRDGAILVNREGRRFCDELQSPTREIAIATQTDKCCYLVLDGPLVEKYSRWPHFVSTAPKIAYAYIQDYQRLRPDITFRGDSLEQAAQRSGLPWAPLAKTIEEHNRASQRQLKHGPWVILGPAKAYFTTTEGGAAIDQQMRVLDAAGEPVRGLYAVGQNGLGGQVLWGHGLHIAWAITSGRLVGRVLANIDDL